MALPMPDRHLTSFLNDTSNSVLDASICIWY